MGNALLVLAFLFMAYLAIGDLFVARQMDIPGGYAGILLLFAGAGVTVWLLKAGRRRQIQRFLLVVLVAFMFVQHFIFREVLTRHPDLLHRLQQD